MDQHKSKSQPVSENSSPIKYKGKEEEADQQIQSYKDAMENNFKTMLSLKQVLSVSKNQLKEAQLKNVPLLCQIDVLKAQVEELTLNLSKSKDELKSKDQEAQLLKDLNTKIAEEKKVKDSDLAKESLVIQSKNKELETKQREVEAKQREIETKQKEIEAKNRELATKSLELDSKSKEVEAKSRDIEVLSKDIVFFKNQIKLQTQSNQEKDQKITDLQEALIALDEETNKAIVTDLEEARKRFANLENQDKAKALEIESQKLKISQLEASIKNKDSIPYLTTITQLEKELQEQVQLNNECQKLIQFHKENVRKLNEQVTKINQDFLKQEEAQDLRFANFQNSVNQSHKKEIQDKTAELREELNFYKENFQKPGIDRIQNLTDQIERLQYEITLSKEENKELRKFLDDKDKVILKLKNPGMVSSYSPASYAQS